MRSTRRRSPGARGTIARRCERGLVLVVVLLVITLLSILAAGYTFLVRAEMDSVQAVINEHQARHAAESGVHAAILALRTGVGDSSNWHNRPDLFRGALVQGAEDTAAESSLRQSGDVGGGSQGGGYGLGDDRSSSGDGSKKVPDPAWRFNLVGTNFDDPTRIRYGLTDECSKLDINIAKPEHLRRLITSAIQENQSGTIENQVNVDELVDSLLDWRQAGKAPRPNGAKDEYYQSRRPPYQCKSAPFATVDELLLVRGFTAAVLYGEDSNRNGLLDGNEDDGADQYPPDNADGVLNRGLQPFLTIWSRDLNVASDSKPRININLKDVDALEERLGQVEGLRPDLSSFILEQRRGGRVFKDVLDLVPVPDEIVEEEGGPLDDIGDDASTSGSESTNGESEDQDTNGASSQPGRRASDRSGGSSDTRSNPRRNPRSGSTAGDETGEQSSGERSDASGDKGASGSRLKDDAQDPSMGGGTGASVGSRQGVGTQSQGQSDQDVGTGRTGRPTGSQRPGGRGSAGGASSQPAGPPPPGTVDDLPFILDRLTTDPLPIAVGRINVNTAPKPVLMSLTELSEEEVNRLISVRRTLDPAARTSTAWLATQGVISLAKLRAILPRITAKSASFAVESVGYADHVEAVKRLYVIIEMRGPIGQVLYYQDYSSLGAAYHPREEETRGASDRSQE